MNNKHTTIPALILSAVMLLTLAGCSADTSSEDSGSSSEVSVITDSTDSSDTSSEPESSVNSEDVTSDNEVKIFSKIRYMRPIYKSTVDDPDWNLKTSDKGFLEKSDEWFGERDFGPIEYFDVKEGDKLENGLTVKEIIVFSNEEYTNERPEIHLEGTLEMEGTLYLQQRDNSYFWSARDLAFYPDSNKNPYIPMCGFGDNDRGERASLWDGTLVQCDVPFQLGSIDKSILDEDEIFNDDTTVKVKLTVDNIIIGDKDNISIGSYCFADIVECERID